LLGTGGLVRAYSGAVQAGLRESTVIEKRQGALLKIRTDYNGIGKIQYLLGQRGLAITNSEYTDIVVIETLVPAEELKELREAVTEGTNGRAEFLVQEEVCFAFADGEPVLF
jgi:putative IMPACT (imprinted ancient) family translation regulator